jgi:hypothetical protein
MTVDEALKSWTHCRQCSCWKGNYTPVENDSDAPNLERKLRIAKGAEVVPVEPTGMWPNAKYTAMVRVFFPASKSGPDKNAVIVPERELFYLAVR